jgi:hypothetical protein
MAEFVLNHEAAIRLGAFSTLLVGLALWEMLMPYRPLRSSKPRRWVRYLAVAVIDTLVLRLMFPAAAVGAALFAQAQGWGLFNYFNTLGWVAIMLSVLALDFAIYLQHVLFHAVPALWRVPRMHHADLRFRRDHWGAFPSHRNCPFHVDQVRGHRSTGNPSERSVDLRSAAERDLLVQSQQCSPAPMARTSAALARCHAVYAPGASLRGSTGDQPQFRI